MPPTDPQPVVVLIDASFNGATLGQSRLGSPDTITGIIDRRPAGLVVTLNVSQGTETYSVTATFLSNVKWTAAVRFRHPGPATLVAHSKYSQSGDDLESDSKPVNVTIQDAGSINSNVSYYPSGTTQPAAALSGASIPVPNVGMSLLVAINADYPLAQNVDCSLDNYATNAIAAYAVAPGLWNFAITLPKDAPRSYALSVRVYDNFGQVQNPVATVFAAIDKTAPELSVTSPQLNAVLVAPQPPTPTQPFPLNVMGVASDVQSGLKTLQYSFLNIHNQTLQVAPNGVWQVLVNVPQLGEFGLQLSATDVSDNSTTINYSFEVAQAYKPKSLEELLSPRSYLRDLLKFVKVNIRRADGTELDSVTLQKALKQPFGDLEQQSSPVGTEILSSLHVPIEVLNASLTTGPLLADWHCDENGMILEDSSPYRNRGSLQPGVRWGREATAGAVDFDGSGYVQVRHQSSLDVGDQNRDFSVSYWLYLRKGFTGAWRNIMHKGNADTERTFAMWMHPDNNKLHYRISTSSNPNDGSDSTSEVALNKWTHVAYIKSGRSLQLYLNGKLDAVATLASDSVSNTGPLYLGKDPWYGGINGALDEIRIYAFALTPEVIQRLAADRGFTPQAAPQVPRYLQVAYETLLTGIGTSYSELRLLPPFGNDPAGKRSSLAQRLDVTEAHIADLLPLATGLAPDWLEIVFGLPQVTADPLRTRTFADPLLLKWRQEATLKSWSDADQSNTSAPDVDPDIIGDSDIAPEDPNVSSSASVLRLLHDRRNFLNGWFSQIRNTAVAAQAAETNSVKGVDAALHSLATFQGWSSVDLEALSALEDSGQSIATQLDALSLDFPTYRRLLSLRRLAQAAKLTDIEWDTIANILLQVVKLIQGGSWRAEEALRNLWPWGFQLSYDTFVFAEWRGNFAARNAWQQRVSRRLSDWDNLQAASQSAAIAAEKAALPVLRDDIITSVFGSEVGDSVADLLSERFLVDLNSNGVTTLTRIDQAITTLQQLVQGLRSKRFAAPAPENWTIAESLPDFDTEWQWIGTYATWQAATMVFLYPENHLLPDLYPVRDAGGNLTRGSAAFAGLIDAVRGVPKLSASDAQAFFASATDPTKPHLSDDERIYFAPMLLGLELQKAGLYRSALDWYGKIYDLVSRTAQVDLLKTEKNQAPAPPIDLHWTLNWLDPHTNAKSGNWADPYTRFTLGTIIQCLLAYADSEYQAAMLDSLGNATQLYLTARDLLTSAELVRIPPVSPDQVDLPNTLFESLRLHAEAAIQKLRRGLDMAGLPLPPDPTRNSNDGRAISVAGIPPRPSQYRFKVLLERAKQLANQAQQFEGQYLAALEKKDVESEKLQNAGATLSVVNATVAVQQQKVTQATDSLTLAQRQSARAAISAGTYQQWIDAGPNQYELAQVGALWDARTDRDVIGALDASIATAQTWSAAAGLEDALPGVGYAKAAIAAGISAQEIAKTVVGGLLDYADTSAQVNGIQASQERRLQEWQLQLALANQDKLIGSQQVAVAQDQVDISNQELAVATLQAGNAQAMINFLTTKFTSVDFYSWLSGILSKTYGFFLQLAAATAKQAELQLAFERQEPTAGIISSDYWKFLPDPTTTSQGSTAGDRMGITGAERLLQDIGALDEKAFSTDKRLLNLTQVFSLARMAPVEFAQFKQTGLLSFATPMQLFDEGFPGHYLRLIKRVRISMVALIPPNVGIRATLTSNGISRVVTGPPNHEIVIAQQDPQWVALTSPNNASGVFDLDSQSDLLLPFEGLGVDTSWTLEMPRPANPFDFETIADVFFTIDYTALSSLELRDRVVQKMPPISGGDIAFSVKSDLPDIWYELANPADTTTPLTVTLPIRRQNYPPQLDGLSTEAIVVIVRPVDGKDSVSAVLTPSFSAGGQPVSAPGLALQNGVISTRRSGAVAWSTLLGKATTTGTWTFAIADDPTSGAPAPVRDRLATGEVDDILIVLTFSGTRPPWN
jgi:hypothetical protein